MWLLVLPFLLGFFFTPEGNAAPPAEVKELPVMHQGESLYLQACAGCHGEKREGRKDDRGRAPALDHTENAPYLSSLDLFAVIKYGSKIHLGSKFINKMPSHKVNLEDEEIRKIVRFLVLSWPREVHQGKNISARKKDKKQKRLRGKTVFYFKCALCHKADLSGRPLRYGVMVPALNSSGDIDELTDDEILSVILDGGRSPHAHKTEVRMPSHKFTLPPGDAVAVVEFLKSNLREKQRKMQKKKTGEKCLKLSFLPKNCKRFYNIDFKMP